MKADISVVLGSYNRKPFLEKAIESVRDNNIHLPYEIIVVDGGSTDGSLKYLEKQKDIITIIQHNRGKWRGKEIKRRSWGYFMNLAFKCAEGKFVCMISDDCLVVPDSIKAAVKEYEKASAESRQIGGVAFYWRDWPDEAKYKIHIKYGNMIAINHGIFLREALEKVGRIDEDRYMFYCADGDLNLRIWEAGYQIIACKKAFVEHFAHAPMRGTHSKQYKNDSAASLERWSHLLTDVNEQNSESKWPTIGYNDPNNTVLQFPRLSLREMIKQKIYFFYRNLRRKIVALIRMRFPHLKR